MMRQFDFPILPKLPDDLRQAVIDNQAEFINYTTYKNGEGRNVLKNGELIPSATFRIRKGPEDVVNWVRDNITKHFIHVGTTESSSEKIKQLFLNQHSG